jgi:putative methionine-R-sulfoxide reductase with GAF domain
MDNDIGGQNKKLQKNAFRIGVLISFLLAVSTGLTLLAGEVSATWQSQILLGMLAVSALLAVGATAVIQRGYVQAGIPILALAPMPIYPTVAALFSDMGIVLGVVVVFQTAAIVGPFLSTRKSRFYTLLGVIVGGATIIVDILWQGQRLAIPPQMERATPIFLLIVILIMGFFVTRQFSTYTLRVKLIAAFLIVSLASLAAISYFTNRTLEATLVRTAAQNVNQFAESQGSQTGALITGQVEALRALAGSDIIVENVTTVNRLYPNNQATVNAQIAELDRQWPTAAYTDPLVQDILTNAPAAQLLAFSVGFRDHVSLMVTDRHGALVAASSRPAQYAQRQESWWQASYNNGEGAVIISQPIFDERTGGYNIIIALPVYGVDGQTAVGVLASVFRIRGLAQALSPPTGEQAAQPELYLGDDLRLLPDVAQPRQSALSAAELELLRNADLPALPLTYDNVYSLVSLSPVTYPSGEQYIADLEWYVIAHQNMDETLTLLGEQERNSFIIAGAVALVATIAALILTQVIISPISRLTESANRIAAGELDVETAVATQDEIGQLAASFNSMTGQLRQTLQGLENRSRALAASAEVSRRLSTILDTQALVNEVVNQVQTAFNYYHVHIYLLDEQRQKLIMSGGTGSAGAAMLAGGHQIALNQGLVGQAASQNKTVLAADVSEQANWLPNPLLPETKSEIAVPIAIAGRPVGVLDVQQNKVNGLGEEDAITLQAIADQVAIALQNARLYAAAERQAGREATVNAIGQRIQNAASIEAVLQIAAEELGKATGAPHTRAQINLQHSPSPRQDGRQLAANGEKEA